MHKDFPSIDIPIVTTLYDFYKKFHKITSSFGKLDRHTIGEKTMNMIIDAISLAISSNTETKYNKEKYIVALHSKMECLKVMIRLAHETENIKDIKDYISLQSTLQEASKMTMGWLKYTRAN